MSISVVAWVEDFSSDDRGLALLVQAQRNLSLARFAAATRVLVQEYSEEPGVRHFAENYALAKNLPPRSLAVVCADPTFVYWNHVTAGLIGRLRNREPIPTTDVPHLAGTNLEEHPLALHLRDVSRFLAAAAFIGGVSAVFECLPLGGEVCLPSLGLVIRAPTNARMLKLEVKAGTHRLGLGDGKSIAVEDVRAAAESGETAHYRKDGVELLRRVQGSAGTMLLNPKDPYYREAWILQTKFPGGLVAREVSEDDLNGWLPTLHAALRLLREVWPEMEAALSRGVHTVVPVSSPLADRSISCSAQSFWGAVLCSLDAEVCLAETLIHEFSHNVLNALMDQHGILAEDCPRDEMYYSPWRPDARPISGIIHAVYVFERVAEFYGRYLRRHPSADAYRPRYASIVGRLVLGLHTLKQSARFNKEGVAFFGRLAAGVEKHRIAGLTTLGAAGRAELAEHLSSWEVRYPDSPVPQFIL